MRRILIFIIAALSGSYVQAQKLNESEVPSAVKQAFLKMFPKSRDVKWEKEDATAIEAEFKMDNSEYSAKFDLSGKWLETETVINKKQLPEAIHTIIAKEFVGFKIEEAEEVEMPDQEPLYEVELKKKEITYAVQFSATGKILKKEAVKETEDKD